VIDLDRDRFKVTAARRAAFDVLRRVESEGAYAGNLLASNRYDDLTREDHALAQELTLGVLRWQWLLDSLIEHYANRRLYKIDPEVVIALRLGLYQLRNLSRIPPHAAINESVNLVKEERKTSAAPLVNAVLRAAQRDPAPNFHIKDPVERLSVETSHPPWLVRRWVDRFDEEETRALALSNNNAPRTAFRFNTESASEEATRAWLEEHGIKTRKSELTPGAEIIEAGSLPPEPVRKGWIYLQDEASQLVAHLCADRRRGEEATGRQGDGATGRGWDEKPERDGKVEIGGGGDFISSPSRPVAPSPRRLRLLDLCAAPGSKAMLLASILPEDSLIVAADLYLHRLRTMKELELRFGMTRINPVQLDAAGPLPFPQPASFDCVLVDAPCSGLGTLQRNPEIKWRMIFDKIRELGSLQDQLITKAAEQVRVGGLLTYSVCSTEPEEGEEVIARFRHNHPEFRDLTRERLTALGLDPMPLLTPSFGARTFPHRQGTEGFFVCVLWRRR
jgi:16S rRNA (cytosine967-C5)-methyltransferase